MLRASHVLAEMTVIVPAMETKSKGTFGYLGNSRFTPALSYPSTVQERREARTMFKMISVGRILFFTEQNISALQFSWELLPAITNHHLCELVMSLFF